MLFQKYNLALFNQSQIKPTKMNSQKRIEAINIIRDFGYVDYTILNNGKMSDEIRTSHIEEIEQAVSVHGAENVYF